MADRRISDFPTLQQAQDTDLILVSSENETYNITFATLKLGTHGDPGTGIASYTEYYATNNSTTAPADSAFSTTVVNPTSSSRYLWGYTLITYTDLSVLKTDKHMLCVYGERGDTGYYLTGITNYYLASANKTGVTRTGTSGWSTTVPELTEAKPYLWSYTSFTRNAGGTLYSTACVVGSLGQKGDKGDTGKSAYQAAVENGYTGTEAQFGQEIANAGTYASSAAQSAASAASSAQSIQSALTNYYTKTQVDTALGAKANSSDVYTKTQTDNLLSAKANSADVYTKTQVDTSLGTKLDKDLSTLTALPQAPTSSDLFAVKSGSDTYKVRFDTIRNAISYSNAGSHNSIYRGENLGNSVTSSQYAQIAAGTFDDLFIGDYWTIDGVNWRIADFDYWLNTGDTSCETHHVVIVPDTPLATCAMNSTLTTAGAYVGSNFYTGANGNTGRATASTAVVNAFGATHVLTHREMFANAVTSGAESNQDFYDSQIELMNECMVYGSNMFHNIIPVNTFYPAFYTISNSQLALFRYRHDLIGIRAGWWLRDVGSTDTFAAVRDSGFSCLDHSTSVNGIRPAFGLISA